jgi:hypothetical protein
MEIVQAIDKIFDVVDGVRDAIDPESPKGKKVTIGEGIGLGIKALGLVPAFTSIGVLIQDWQERDPAKKAEWIAKFKERFDLEDDELEEQIESLIATLLTLEGALIK